MPASVARLKVLLHEGDEADPETLSEAAGQLREELLELDVARVDVPSDGQPPPGTRAGDLVALGSLIVSLAQSSGLLTAVVATVQSWVSRHGSRSVRLELDGDVLEVSGISSREQRELVETWVRRHSAVGDDHG
jgi:hypothetical protein